MARDWGAGSIGTALARAARRLAALDETDPRLEAELLLAHLLERPRSHLHAWPGNPLPEQQETAYHALVERRLAGEPLAYLTGEREFWSLSLRVTPDTLVPRPDTELLVELALELIPPRASWRIADLGTGSGAIAAAVAHERPACRVIATDRSAAALAVARDNFERLGLGTVECLQGDWLEPLAGRPPSDLILSNPPYVAAADPHLQTPELQHEPLSALVAGDDGLSAIRRIAEQAPAHLRAGGRLLLEHGFQQGAAVRRILRQAGFGQIGTHRDLAGNERVTAGRIP